MLAERFRMSCASPHGVDAHDYFVAGEAFLEIYSDGRHWWSSRALCARSLGAAEEAAGLWNSLVGLLQRGAPEGLSEPRFLCRRTGRIVSSTKRESKRDSAFCWDETIVKQATCLCRTNTDRDRALRFTLLPFVRRVWKMSVLRHSTHTPCFRFDDGRGW